MKTVIVTQEDPFYVPLFFKRFYEVFKEKDRNIEIVGVVIQDALGNKSKFSLAKRMVGFYGFWGFIVQSFKYVFQKIQKKMHKWHILSKSFSIEYFTTQAGYSVLPFKDVNSEDFITWSIENKIDLIQSVAASQIFKKRILETPKYGCVNIHNAPLPNYRGMLPNFWQMFHGEKYSVMTIHEMVEKLDAGRIIAQVKTEIKEGMTLDELIRETKVKNAEALIDVWTKFEEGDVVYTPLPNQEGSYFTFPNRDDMKKFKKLGYRIF